MRNVLLLLLVPAVLGVSSAQAKFTTGECRFKCHAEGDSCREYEAFVNGARNDRLRDSGVKAVWDRGQWYVWTDYGTTFKMSFLCEGRQEVYSSTEIDAMLDQLEKQDSQSADLLKNLSTTITKQVDEKIQNHTQTVKTQLSESLERIPSDLAKDTQFQSQVRKAILVKLKKQLKEEVRAEVLKELQQECSK